MSKWQPIEMAPKDGTPVLAGGKSSMTSWIWIPYPLTSRFLDGRWTADFGKDEWRPYAPQPTHWMPLPEPPDA